MYKASKCIASVSFCADSWFFLSLSWSWYFILKSKLIDKQRLDAKMHNQEMINMWSKSINNFNQIQLKQFRITKTFDSESSWDLYFIKGVFLWLAKSTSWDSFTLLLLWLVLIFNFFLKGLLCFEVLIDGNIY